MYFLGLPRGIDEPFKQLWTAATELFKQYPHIVNASELQQLQPGLVHHRG
jgi:hypothetical protein